MQPSSPALVRCARLLVAGACVLVAGCMPDNRLPDLPRATPPAYANAATTPGLAPDLEHWWRAFDDPALDALVERALADNLSLQMAGERLRAARALHHRARSEFWPNLNFRIYEETAPGGNTGYLEMGFDSTWEFGFFGRAEGSARNRRADLATAQIDAAAARVSLIAEVVRDYIELRGAQARAAIADDVLAARQIQATLAERRLALHLGSALDADHARADVVQARADATDAQAAIAQTRQALAVLLGRFATDLDNDTALAPTSRQPALPALSLTAAPADLLRTRPEVRRAEANVLHAAGDLGIARADLYPRLSIVGTLISSTALTGDLDRPNKAVPLLGPALSLPIFDWGQRRDVVNAREAALRAAVLAYREAVLEGVADVESALAQFGAKSRGVDDSAQALALAEKSRGASLTLERIGLADRGETAAATLGVAQSRLAQGNALRERALAYVALYKALGGALPTVSVEAGARMPASDGGAH